MIRYKKEIKSIIVAVFFIGMIFLSNIQILNNFSLTNDSVLTDFDNSMDTKETPNTSDLNLDDYIVGSGTNQDVRIYTNNQSKNLNNNQEYFEIPTLSTEDMYLSYGDFNFTFQNNYTTEYIIEDDSALYASDFIKYQFNTDTDFSGITINQGNILNPPLTLNYITDNNVNSFIRIGSVSSIVNFTIHVDYTGRISSSYLLPFDKTKILSFIPTMILKADKAINITIRIKDTVNARWITVAHVNNIEGNSQFSISKTIENHLINTNLNYININDTCYVEYVINRSDLTSFEVRLVEFDMPATYAIDLPITNTEYVALEFDLKGEKSTVNGFYAWIRTLNVSAATNAELNITLYKANATIIRDFDVDSNGQYLRNNIIEPVMTYIIDSTIVKYNNDNLSYFAFNNLNTKDLELFNYFIVIKSNISNAIYSLVTLPYYDWGDFIQRTEQQLKTTINDGVSWSNAKKVISVSYTTGQLDASSFKLNVTRGYMPSDFEVEGDISLKILNNPIENLINKSTTPYLSWGLGHWNNTFSPFIEEVGNQFQVFLSWNKSITNGFKFNVTYFVEAFWITSATSLYNASYNKDPKWNFEFDFDKNNPNFNNWNFIEFWFIYPKIFHAYNLTQPNSEKIFEILGGESVVDDSPSKNKVVVNASTSMTGIYILELVSFNFISEMHSYINYYGTLWETNGFMYGDNISMSLVIQDPDKRNPKPTDGYANVTLFDSNGINYPLQNNIESTTGVVKDWKLIYDFNNEAILNLDTSFTSFGKYYLGYFWTNGSAVGCKKITIYIDTYNLELNNLYYAEKYGKNILDGEILNCVYDNFTILIGSINETTVISQPGFYPINNSNLNEQIIYSINGDQIPVLIKDFMQSEDILNPSEVVNLKTTISNQHPFIPLDISVNIKLVSYINEEWIIAESTSSSITLNFSGTPNDSHQFDINLTLPNLNTLTKTWEGVNAPIRLGGAKTIITIYDDDVVLGSYVTDYYSLLSNETSNNFDGNIIDLKVIEEATDILYFIERDECQYLPENTSFLINIIDRNYVSSYNQFYKIFSLILNSKFTNIENYPEIIIIGQTFNLTSKLATEFDEILTSKNVSCYYYDSSNSPVYLASQITNIGGNTTFSINTAELDFEGNLLITLSWDGESLINGVSKNITIDINVQINEISIQIQLGADRLFRNTDAIISVKLSNIGDSILELSDIEIQINGNLKYSIVGIDYLTLERFSPGITTTILIKVSISEIEKLNLSISIITRNIITGEVINFTSASVFNLYNLTLLDYFMNYIFLFIIGIFILIWLAAFLYARKTKRFIETPIGEEIEKKPRKGRYVLVSELKKEPKKEIKKASPPPKKIAKEIEEPKEVKEKRVTDLDSLLEEKGLDDKNKKSKK